MVSFEEALRIVLSHPVVLQSEQVPLEKSLLRVLATDVFSDISMPPFIKSAVDGFACRFEDLGMPLRILETIPAGVVPGFPVTPGTCTRIMTGAMVPEGADGVIMVEDTRMDDSGRVIFLREKSSRNLCMEGEDIRKGDKVLSAGTRILPPHVAVLASVGEVNPLVSCLPRVAVISTGDELVPPGQLPGKARIRDSNSYQLISQLHQTGIPASSLGIVRDTKDAIRSTLGTAMENFDVVILTGGVSMGDFDYVPEILQQVGVNILFKSIAIQPGRPTVFGKTERNTLFGLPGNPVSSFVLYELLVKPFLMASMAASWSPPVIRLSMGETYSRKKSARKSIIPVKIKNGEVFPAEYHGSAHIHAYTQADGMIEMEIGTESLSKGTLINVRPL